MRVHVFDYLITAALLLASFYGVAHDLNQTKLADIAAQNSGISPPESKLGTYVIDNGSGLDTGCTYKSEGPLRININIPKVLNDSVLHNGRIDVTKLPDLVAQKVIGSTVMLSMPIFDVDSEYSGPDRNPEIDKVSFNGKYVGTLQGKNLRWTETRLEVPIEEVIFGQNNEVKVDIDTANDGNYWCMSVDWVAAEFDVALPIVLIHGINAQKDSWDDDSAPGILASLDELGIKYERFSLHANGTAETNAYLMAEKITPFLEGIKSEKVHIIAHSKGGLDTQYLQAIGADFGIASLSTFSTPHLGSVAADLSVIKIRHAAYAYRNNGADPNGYASAYLQLPTVVGPQMPGIADLTTHAANDAILQGVRGGVKNLFSIGANADLNQDGVIEKEPDLVGLFPWGARWAGVRAWQALRNFSSAAYVTTKTESRWMGRVKRVVHVVEYEAVPQQPQENDVVVTLSSANPSFATSLGNVLGNHSTMKNRENLQLFLNQIVSQR
ncbi:MULTISPECIES: esterase/lipase family protein [unclassified Pseudoalteromonas]|uniref:esterase/lipase family protein n=1 Tax=unclassified Pseudoalteromonas TaxID=194690 RepID=UPI0030146D82